MKMFNKNNDSDYTELEVNKKNLKEYEDLMEKSSYKYDSYFNSNNPLIRLILLVLFLIIVFGVAYYLFSWASL